MFLIIAYDFSSMKLEKRAEARGVEREREGVGGRWEK
jgi:hypothetical protein